MMKNDILEYMDYLYPNPICELNYNKDYELLIAVMLSARTTDKMVNNVTKKLFSRYDINSLSKLDYTELFPIIRMVGSYERKSKSVVEICKSLLNNYNGTVPNNREYLESLSGVGRKTTNVVLSILYNVPCIAVDTHVDRISKRLKIALIDDKPLEVENKLMNFFPKEKWSKLHLQFVLFGRYKCKSRNPNCYLCRLEKYCKKNKA